MSETDLSKIVSLIMENPKLIEEIRSLGEKGEKNDGNEPGEIEEKKDTPRIPIQERESATRRKALLSAIKPYVSSERGRAIDSMISIAEILDMMRTK